MAYITAVSNQKGGVGKTTTAVNLAASLAALEKNTLLIDMDPQANATSGVGVYEPSVTIYDGLLGEKTLEEMVVPTTMQFLSILPASADLVGFEIEGLELEDRQNRLKMLLTTHLDNYDHVVIDCPPSLSLLTLNALCAANGVLVPMQAEYYALEGLSRLTQTIERIKESFNPQLALDGIVLTMFDKRTSLATQVENEVSQHFGSKLLETKIPRNVRLSEAPSFGKPIILYDIRSVGAQSYIQLANEYDYKIQQKGKNHERNQTSGSRDLNSYSHSA